jgi:hypothetical protein
MKDLISKISSYNLFNYLFPGIIFVVLAGDLIRYPVFEKDIITAGFICYFLGLVISRVGSLFVERILKALSFVRFADYRDYVLASQKDEQLLVLSEANNTYRTLASLFILLLFLRAYAKLEAKLPSLKSWDSTILAVLLLLIFLYSYQKQSSYITKRIRANVEDK